MCGITGIIYKDPDRSVDPIILHRANDTLTHRGPDDSGYYIDGNVGIAMRRLSIIDVAGGHQPVSNETEQIHIVYNGELYNYQHLRETLQQKGHKFKTKTDTESILHNYEEKGTDLFADLNGMFAFAIWDSTKKSLLIGRDRLGIKPLFYYEDDEKFIFASEIKAILAFPDSDLSFNNEALFDFLTFTYIPCPATIYQKIKKLPPGAFLQFHENQTTVKLYWQLEYNINHNWTLKDATNKLEELLYDAIKIRLMSEVPLGAFLSGGIDSSAIAYFISQKHLKDNLHTFSIGFATNSVYNELPFSKIVAEQLQTFHHTQIVKPRMVDLLPKVVSLLDEPMADPSVIPTYLLSQFTREHVTVALSGDGGDELFAGYERQRVMNILRRFYSMPDGVKNILINKIFSKINPVEQKDSLFASVKRILSDVSAGYLPTYKRWITNFNSGLLQQILTPDLLIEYHHYNSYRIVEECFAACDDAINQSLNFETRYYLPDDLLVKVDRMSMGNSLEVRVPFLDHRIVEFASTLPMDFKIKGKTGKYILKNLMKRYLPKEIIKKPKQGFSPPIKEWLKDELREYCHDALLSSNVLNKYNKYGIEKLLNEHYTGKRDFQYQIWTLLILSQWLETNKSML
ncbi:MAG: asparagine synthase (glutamine-hydrolyzing) [Candidatus Marinimicrobia bacterium]|nr:asparagine synthase (glutamine-hydrolyzing) [Candidatus Neomarinimicrobiota bacterium]